MTQISPTTRQDLGIDLDKLRMILDRIDFSAIRKRRATYTRLYHEARISDRQGKGMSFTGMLFLLAHHKLIVDRDALVYVFDLAWNDTN